MNQAKDDASGTIVSALKTPAAYIESTGEVQHIETHISWVFLTDQHAYKLKKPIELEFLDYGTIEKRREMCKTEVRLNQRLAPNIYLDVVKITNDNGRIRVDGSGNAVDWLVKMKRLRDDANLEAILRSKDQEACEVKSEGLIRSLKQFYSSLPCEQVGTDEYRQGIVSLVNQNLEQFKQLGQQRSLRQFLDRHRLEQLHSTQLQMLELDTRTFAQRIKQHAIVEGHGDLRPEHIYYQDGEIPAIIDGIEFNRGMRIVDILDELSFFEMECDRLGAASLGRRVTDEVLLSLGDEATPELRNFYKCYRACVRAKVALIRAAQQLNDDNHRHESLERMKASESTSEAAMYISLARRYERQFAQPLLIVVRGLMGSGKTTIAKELARRLAIEHIMTDQIRHSISFREPSAQGQDEYGQGKYSLTNRLKVYNEMFARADRALEARRSIILDGTFLSTELRSHVMALADRHGVPCIILRCVCPREETLKRIATRHDSLSEARIDLFDEQQRHEEHQENDCQAAVLTTGTVEASVTAAIEHLRGHLQSVRRKRAGERGER